MEAARGRSASAPVFMVGPSRSGTALLRSIVNLNDEVMLAGETHYFDDLRPRLAAPTEPLGPGELESAVAYFLALSHRRYGFQGEAEAAPLPRELLEELGHHLGGSGDAFFEAFCRLSAQTESDPDFLEGPRPDLDRIGPPRWGEKTPRHAFRIDDELSAFPRAQVIAMVRDPRAVVSSYAHWRTSAPTSGMDADPAQAAAVAEETKRARRSFHPVIATTMCRGAIHAAEAALQAHGPDRVRLVRYESLVDEPERVVSDLCTWLGIEFSAAMLEAPIHNSSFEKVQMQAGIQSRSRDRWRSVLSPSEIAVVQSMCTGVMSRWDYEKVDTGRTQLAVAGHFASLPIAAVRAAGANRERIASLPDYVLRRVVPSRRRVAAS